MNSTNEFNENFISEHLDPLASHTSDFPFHELDGEQENADGADFSVVGDTLRNLFRWIVEPLSTHGGPKAQKLIAERVLALATATTPELFEANLELLQLAAKVTGYNPRASSKESFSSRNPQQGPQHHLGRAPKVQKHDADASNPATEALLRGFRAGIHHIEPSANPNPSKAKP